MAEDVGGGCCLRNCEDGADFCRGLTCCSLQAIRGEAKAGLEAMGQLLVDCEVELAHLQQNNTVQSDEISGLKHELEAAMAKFRGGL